MNDIRRSRSQIAAYLLLAVALVLGARLVLEGFYAQFHRLSLVRAQGLGFTDPYCTTGYCDYTMFWLAGTLARHGQAALLYHPARYAAAAAKILPYRSGYWPFIYPPLILGPAAVLPSLPLAAGYYVFTLAQAVLGIFLLRGAGLKYCWIAAGLLSPMAMWDLYLGQIGLICGAILLLGLTRLAAGRRQAGALLGLLALKPQYALLLPVCVLARRNFRAIGQAGMVIALLALLSLGVAGWAAWPAYFGPGRAAMRGLMGANFGRGPQDGAVSVFWMLRSLHLPPLAAATGQAASAAAAALACWRLWRGKTMPAARLVTLTVLLGYFVSPYCYNDDLAVFAVLLPSLARGAAPWRNAALAWLWLLPAYVPRIALATGFLPTPLLILAATCLAYKMPAEG